MMPEAEKPIDLFAQLKHEALYALRSRSRALVYQCHGAALMAEQLKAINHEQGIVLNTMLIRNGLNNPQYCRENFGGVLE